MRRIALAAASLCGLAACSDSLSSPEATSTATSNLTPSAPTLAKAAVSPIAGQYIVRYRTSALGWQARANAAVAAHGAQLKHTYSAVFQGASMTMTAAAAQALASDPDVLSVEQDQTVTIATTQTSATWGLDRLDQRARPLDQSYTYGPSGTGVTVYIIDTGINYGQTDFQGRATNGVDIVTTGGTGADCNGHGTHVAGTVGSATYGVAKSVVLKAVRVLDCAGSGSMSGVIAGVDYVVRNAPRPAVANMSLGGGYSSTLNTAVENAIAAGITFAIAAGNSGADACTASPASAPSAITVGATDSNDNFQSWSNWGSCVRINAPGAAITSLWLGTGTNTISGTSMASPHVAGAAALYLQNNPTATPAQVRSALTSNATSAAIPNAPTNTPNLLLYTGFMNAPVTTPPVASFTASCSFLSCTFDAGASTALATATYTWNFGDATSGSGKTITHVYGTSGSYAVTLTVADANGSNARTTTVVATANKAPTASISSPASGGSFTQSNGAVAVTFTGAGNDPETGALSGTSLVWTSSRDGQIGTGTSFVKSNLTVGTHTITLTSKDAQGLTGSASTTITIVAGTTVNQPPTASITSPATGSSFTQGASITFSGAGTDPETGALSGASLVWTSSRDGQIGTGASFATTTLTVGTHTITLTATDPQGAAATSTLSITITAVTSNQAPVASFTYVCGPLVSSYPHTCALDGSASTDDVAVVRWVWNLGNGKTPSKTVPNATYSWAAAGNYWVTLTVLDAQGLQSSKSMTVVVP